MANETLSAQLRPVQLYQEVWVESIRRTLEQIGPDVHIERLPSTAPDESILGAAGSGLWIRFSVSGQLQGEHAFFLSPSDARSAQAGAPEKPEAEATLLESHRESLTKLFGEIGEAAAADLKTKLGWEVNLKFEGATGPEWPPEAPLAIQVNSASIPPIRIYSFASSELEHSLFETASDPVSDAAAGAEKELSSPSGRPRGDVMERLMDAELEVVLRFGERQMPLREILELNSGSVVEFDQDIGDRVELLVAGKVFARGEVVVVDGNYGLRIMEIVSPQQREDFLGKKGPHREERAGARSAAKGS